MKIFLKVLTLTVLLCVVWCPMVVALPPKKVFINTGAVDHGVQSGTAKPLFSIGLGPFSLQLGVQQWGSQPTGQTPHAGMNVPTNITLPSLTILVPNAMLNVSGLQQPGSQPPIVWVVPTPNGGAPAPSPPPPQGGSMPPVPEPTPVPIPPLQVPWETTTTVVVPGQPGGGGAGAGGGGAGADGGGGEGGGFIITETTDSMGNVMQTVTPIGQQPGQTVLVPGPTTVVEEVVIPSPNQPGIIRRGVITRLTGTVLQRNSTKPIINLIKGN